MSKELEKTVLALSYKKKKNLGFNQKVQFEVFFVKIKENVQRE